MQKNCRTVIIHTDTTHLLVLHGALQLALRHPGWNGPSAALGASLLKQFDETLAASGLFSSTDINMMRAGTRMAIADSESRRT